MSEEFLKYMVMKDMKTQQGYHQQDNTQLIIFCLMLIFIYVYEKRAKEETKQHITPPKHIEPYLDYYSMRFLT
jgi:hypothetical protein